MAGDKIVWIDCEMTGLDVASDALIEVAAVVTDGELNVLGNPVDVLIAPPASALESMGDVVRTMHTSSGLLDDLALGTDMASAEAAVLAYVREFVPEAGRAPLAGNSMGFDRKFLERDMPRLAAHLHYRSIDVSSLKELVRRWYPRAYFQSPAKTGNHRALGDILDSIRELKYYRAAVFVPLPGPTSDEAAAAARAVVDGHAVGGVGASAGADSSGAPGSPAASHANDAP